MANCTSAIFDMLVGPWGLWGPKSLASGSACAYFFSSACTSTILLPKPPSHKSRSMSAEEKPADKCPVDHTARAAWLEAARKPPADPSTATTATGATIQDGHAFKTRPLSQEREVSSIPRTDPSLVNPALNISSRTGLVGSASHLANNESESGADVRSGNWVYPSEKMFFEAMRRKDHSPRATDMAAIVPIHNAVNERAWKEIREWESGYTSAAVANAKCGGPRLHSFSGDSRKLTPRARWNTLLGYSAPFDRHDWVVERCSGEPAVEYVIDFYAGKDDGKGRGLNFYLDVRPKLNTWEGWKMRASRLIRW